MDLPQGGGLSMHGGKCHYQKWGILTYTLIHSDIANITTSLLHYWLLIGAASPSIHATPGATHYSCPLTFVIVCVSFLWMAPTEWRLAPHQGK